MREADVSALEIRSRSSWGVVDTIGGERLHEALGIVAEGIGTLYPNLTGMSFVSWLNTSLLSCPPYLAISVPRGAFLRPARYTVGFRDAQSPSGWRPVSLEWPTDLWNPARLFGTTRRNDTMAFHDRNALFDEMGRGTAFGCESDFGWVPLIDVPHFGSVAELRMKMELMGRSGRDA